MSKSSTQQNQEYMVKTMKLMMDALAAHTGYLHMISEQLKSLQTVIEPLQDTLESISHNTASLKPPSSPIMIDKIDKIENIDMKEKILIPKQLEEEDKESEDKDEINENSFQSNKHIVYVLSSSKSGKTYSVNIAYGTCDCPDYQYRHKETHTCCKHLIKIMADPFIYGVSQKQIDHLRMICKC